MTSKYKHYRWLLGCLILVLAAAGCFQDAGDGGLQSQPVSQVLATNTLPPTPIPTETPVPSATSTATATEATADVFNISDVASPTSALPIGTSVAQQLTPQGDPFALTATQLVVQATQTAEIPLTQTAQALFGASDTPTPTATFSDGLSPTQPILPGANCVHQARAGDTLFSLSLTYGVLVNEIALASGVSDINRISVGQSLTIPGCGTTGVRPPATPTPIPTATPPGLVTQAPLIPATQPVASRNYIVQQGDTLFRIALQFGVDLDAIVVLNGITNINRIDMGAELLIP